MDRDALAVLRPDLLLLDREENVASMAEHADSCPVHTTHVQAVRDVSREMDAMAELFGNERLRELANEWREVRQIEAGSSVGDMPGVLQWLKPPLQEPEQILYLIWSNPWMAVSRDTFVGSMLSQVGIQIPVFSQKYPKVELAQYDPAKTLLLFSSEPFPFAKKTEELKKLDFSSAIVDGEAYSWFGIRSLKFLQGLR
jgi:hypothetical protein